MTEVDLIAAFHQRLDRTQLPAYEDREGRNRWASSLVRTLPGRRILNLGGGGRRHLQKHLGADWQVHEIDITGDCDTLLNLDTVDRLPFESGSFDTTCAFEVLEHLEQLHLIANEMYRVATHTMLISLPNAAVEFVPILRDIRAFRDPLNNGVYSKFYGLPLAPPEDRHRWWLTFEDIIRFSLHFAEQQGAKLQFLIPDDEFSLKRRLFRKLAGERRYLNFFCSTVWIRFTKPGVAGAA
jgi:hypothetical protein